MNLFFQNSVNHPDKIIKEFKTEADDKRLLLVLERVKPLEPEVKAGGDAKILSAIANRRTVSTGSVFLRGNEWLESAYDAADVVRGARGFRYVNSELLLSSGCDYRYPPGDEPERLTGADRARTRRLAVYLNGLRVLGGLAELKTSVTMRDILAVEAYQDILSAPLEWRTNDACAVLAIWTSR